jgi:hypothetical protein
MKLDRAVPKLFLLNLVKGEIGNVAFEVYNWLFFY